MFDQKQCIVLKNYVYRFEEHLTKVDTAQISSAFEQLRAQNLWKVLVDFASSYIALRRYRATPKMINIYYSSQVDY